MKRFTSVSVVLAMTLVVLDAAVVSAQFAGRNKVEILDPRVGLPAGQIAGERDSSMRAAPVSKEGHWAPITFRLKVLGESNARFKLVVETTDYDDYRTIASWPLGDILTYKNPASTDDNDKVVMPGEMPYTAYVKLGRQGEVTLRIWTDDGDASYPVSESRVVTVQSRNPSTFAVLSLGNIRTFRLPAVKSDISTTDANTSSRLRNGRVEIARCATIDDMPDQWFGYDGIDLVVMTTAGMPDDFLANLFDKDKSSASRYLARREALLEYVRRGGRLFITCGKKGNDLLQMEAFTRILPANIAATDSVDKLLIEWGTGRSKLSMPPPPKKTAKDSENDKEKQGEPEPERIPILKLSAVADRLPNCLMPASTPSAPPPTPLVVQGALGLGKITLAAFDIDDPAVLSSLSTAEQAELWQWCLRNAGPARAYDTPQSVERLNSGYSTPLNVNGETENGIATGIRNHIDTFEGVPVISFGWIALFILLYTLIIGPIEYLFLKKILGRLELTWITFPLIVLTVSVAAYYTAYSVKGKDTKTNKIDLIDVVLDPDGGGRIYGRSWFTIFSPRTEYYTLALEPKPTWSPPATGKVSGVRPASTILDWFGGTGGNKATNQGGFTRRSYNYRIDATGETGNANGLTGVPTLVWSTKAYTGQWAGRFEPGNAPIVSTLAHPPANRETATGTVTVNLPLGDVVEAAFIYRDALTPVRALPVGKPLTFLPRPDGELRSNLLAYAPWFRAQEVDEDQYQTKNYGRTYPTARQTQSPTMNGEISLWGAFFHEASAGGEQRLQNSSLRTLDQSWRLRASNTEEVILIAKLRTVSGVAEELMSDPTSPSPTSLWLHGWPGGDKPRDPWPGTLKQETYVRFFIPVRAVGGVGTGPKPPR